MNVYLIEYVINVVGQKRFEINPREATIRSSFNKYTIYNGRDNERHRLFRAEMTGAV